MATGPKLNPALISFMAAQPLFFVATAAPGELLPFYEELGEKGIKAYWARKNRLSIDGKEMGIQNQNL